MAESEVPVLKPMNPGMWRHGGMVSCLKFSHDGKLLASGSADKVVRIWAIPRGRNFRDGRFLGSHDDAISLLDFSPDDKLLASSSWDGTVKVWNLTNGSSDFSKPVSVLSGHENAVNAVAFLPDGKSLVTCGEDGTIRMWDAFTGKEQKRIHAGGGILMHLCLVPSSPSHLFVATQRQVLLWNLTTNQMVLFRNAERICYLANSKNLQHIAAAGAWGRVYLWDCSGRTIPHDAKILHAASHEEVTNSVAFSPDSKLLALGGSDQIPQIRDAKTRQLFCVCEGHNGAVHDVAFSPDGKMLAAAGGGWIINLWDLTVLAQPAKPTIKRELHPKATSARVIVLTKKNKEIEVFAVKPIKTDTFDGYLVLLPQPTMEDGETPVPADKLFGAVWAVTEEKILKWLD